MLRKQARLFKNQNLAADFLRGNAELGDIFQLDDRGWVIVTNIFALMPDLDKAKFLLKPSTAKDLSFTTETGTEIKFNGIGSSGEIGALEAEIAFGSRHSAFVSLKDAQWQNIDLQKIKPYIDKLWNDNNYRNSRYFFINQICLAKSGVTIFSEDRSNVVKLQSNTATPLTNIGIIGEANVDIIINKKETLEIISNFEHAPLFQAVGRTHRGKWEILG